MAGSSAILAIAVPDASIQKPRENGITQESTCIHNAPYIHYVGPLERRKDVPIVFSVGRYDPAKFLTYNDPSPSICTPFDRLERQGRQSICGPPAVKGVSTYPTISITIIKDVHM